MVKIIDDDPKITEEVKVKIERREKKRKPKMKVSGKRVFQLKKIIHPVKSRKAGVAEGDI